MTAAAAAALALPAPAMADVIADTDFSGGTTGESTWIREPGELQLKPALGETFQGSTLPTTFEATPAGGATVDAGTLTVDGARAGAVDATGPGTVLEFRAVFSSDAFQHVGFGEDFDNGPWAMFSTNMGGSTLYARTQTGSQATDTPVPGVDPLLPHVYRIEWTDDDVRFFVDGQEIATDPVVIAGAMRALASDFNVGGGTVEIDWLTASPFATPGTFESRVLDAGDVRARWDALTATGGATASFETASGTTPDALSSFQPLGPGGAIQSPPGRYIKYRATLSTDDDMTSPTLTGVSIGYTLDTTAPAAVLAPVAVAGSTATLTFSSTAADLAQFQCSLDGGTFANCTSPKQYTGLDDGTHTVAVRAVDDVGNIGNAAEDTFPVDATAPVVTVDAVAVSGTTATVTFSSPATDVASFECRLDTGAYTTCTSPHQLTGVAEGAHTVAVRAVDAAGNTGPAETREFTIAATLTPPPGGNQPPAVLPSGNEPPDTKAPAIKLGARRITAVKRASLRLACPADEVSCRVDVRLKDGKRSAGRAGMTIAGGQKRTLAVTLSRKARERLARRGRLNVVAVITATDSTGNRSRIEARLTLRAP